MSSELITPGLPDEQGRGAEPLLFATRLFLLFLQGLFKQFESGSYKWSDDERLSEISITNEMPFPKDRAMQRPALITQRGGTQFTNLSLDNMRTVDAQTGAKERTDLLACSMSIHCMSRVPLEAQRMGWIVMRHIRDYKTTLQQAGLAKIGDDLSVSGLTPPGTLVQPEADTELVMVTVLIPFFMQWSERVTPTDAPILREIRAHISTQLGTGPGSTQPTPVRRYPRMLGQPLSGASTPLDPQPAATLIVKI